VADLFVVEVTRNYCDYATQSVGVHMQYCRFRHIIQTVKRGLDLLELDAITHVLYLIVLSTFDVQLAIGGIQSDDPRGLAYVASGRGIDVYSLEPPNLSGVVKYVSYEADRTIGLTYVDPAELPVRGVAVELRDANDTVIATTNTTGTGYYSFVAPKNITATIVVKAALGDPKQPNVTVRDNQHAACPAADPDSVRRAGRPVRAVA